MLKTQFNYAISELKFMLEFRNVSDKCCTNLRRYYVVQEFPVESSDNSEVKLYEESEYNPGGGTCTCHIL